MSMRALKQVIAGRVKANHRKVGIPEKENGSDYEDQRSGEERVSPRFHYGRDVARERVISSSTSFRCAARPSRKVAKTAGKNRDLRVPAGV
jgi:hypothetical protein